MKVSQFSKVLSVLFVVVLALGVVAPAAFAKSDKPKDIYSIIDLAEDVNSEFGEFNILLAAIDAADPAIRATLDGKGQYTVFAPTDAAFIALLIELGYTPQQLLSNQELVTEVLLYHVVHGKRNANSVIGSSQLRTLQGGFLYQDGGVLTDMQGRTSNIIDTNYFVDNGVVHIIDTVVLP